MSKMTLSGFKFLSHYCSSNQLFHLARDICWPFQQSAISFNSLIPAMALPDDWSGMRWRIFDLTVSFRFENDKWQLSAAFVSFRRQVAQTQSPRYFSRLETTIDMWFYIFSVNIQFEYLRNCWSYQVHFSNVPLRLASLSEVSAIVSLVLRNSWLRRSGIFLEQHRYNPFNNTCN